VKLVVLVTNANTDTNAVSMNTKDFTCNIEYKTFASRYESLRFQTNYSFGLAHEKNQYHVPCMHGIQLVRLKVNTSMQPITNFDLQ